MKDERPKIKTDNTRNFENIKKYLIKCGADFEIILTNYTAQIKCDFTIQSAKNHIETRAFIAYQKIKSDLINYTANEMPARGDINIYFDTNDLNLARLNDINILHNIDLSSAYLTILFNSGFISPETFIYCNEVLNKRERLQCVGMLAAKKSIFKYERGELVNAYEQFKDTEGVFFYCVDQTAQIINNIKNLIGADSFVFSWVDSVYYLNPAHTLVIQDYLNTIKIKSKYKLLENVRIKETGNFYLLQHGNEQGKNTFHLPKKDDQYKKELLKFLKLM